MSASPHSPSDKRLALALFVASLVLFLVTEKAIGFTRDESVYFTAAESYAGWMKQLFQTPSLAISDEAIVRAYDFNHEHPALMKNLFGLSFLVFHEGLGLRPATAFRLPAFVFSALIPALLFLLGAAIYGRWAGLFAALSFLVIPRQFFHAHLSCFDMPVATMWLVVVYTFWRALSEKRFALWCGLAFGLALATKHNALFLPFVLAPLALGVGWKASKAKEAARFYFLALWAVAAFVGLLYGVMTAALGPERFLSTFALLSPQTALFVLLLAVWGYFLPQLRHSDTATFRAVAPLFAMAALGPIVFYLHWPYLWHHPVERTAWYLAFHAQHNHYAWFYLGDILRAPPFPLEYVLVKTAMTVPVSIWVPMALGSLGLLIQGVASWVPGLKKHFQPLKWTDALLGINALASIAILSHPQVPHFGGVKHWFPSMLFLGLLAGNSVQRAGTLLVQQVQRLWPLARPSLVAGTFQFLLLLPAGIATARNHPWGTAYYSELAGGLPGAASLGMQRQFWSSHVTGIFDWLNANGPMGARLYLHEVNGYSFRDYQRNGMLRKDFRVAYGPNDADIAAYQYHQEFREHEFNICQAFGTTKPVYGLYVDGTPQVVVYQRSK